MRYTHQRMNSHKLNNSEVCATPVASVKLKTLKLGLDVHTDTIVVVRLLDEQCQSVNSNEIPPATLRNTLQSQANRFLIIPHQQQIA